MESLAKVVVFMWLIWSATALLSNTVYSLAFLNVSEPHFMGSPHDDVTFLVVVTVVFIFSGGLRSIAGAAEAVSYSALQSQSVIDRLLATAKYQTPAPNGAEECLKSVPVAAPQAARVPSARVTPGTSKWARRRARKAAAKAAAAATAPPATPQTEPATPVMNSQFAPAVTPVAALPLTALVDGVPLSLTLHVGKCTPPAAVRREAGSPVRLGLDHWSFGRRPPCHFGARCRYGPSACLFEHADPPPPRSTASHGSASATALPTPSESRTPPLLDVSAVANTPVEQLQSPASEGQSDTPDGVDDGAAVAIVPPRSESVRPMASESPVGRQHVADAPGPVAPQSRQATVAAHGPPAGARTAGTSGVVASSRVGTSPLPRYPLRRSTYRPCVNSEAQVENFPDVFNRMALEAVQPYAGMHGAGTSQQTGLTGDATCHPSRPHGRTSRARGRGGRR